MHDHRAEGGSGRHAEDVGAGQRVADEALEDLSRDPEGGPDQDAGEDPRQAQGADDELAVGAAAEAAELGDDVAHAGSGSRRPTRSRPARPRSRARVTSETNTARPSTRADRGPARSSRARARPLRAVVGGGDRTAGRGRRSQLGDPATAHEGDEDGRAQEGGDDADLELARAHDHPADRVGGARRAAPRSME